MGGTSFVPFCIFLFFFSSIGKLLTVFSKNLTVTSPNCFPSTSKWTPLLRIQCINLLETMLLLSIADIIKKSQYTETKSCVPWRIC